MERDSQFQYGNHRPITQAQLLLNSNTKYTSNLDPSSNNYDGGSKRPLTINSGKPVYGRSPYYGNLRVPIKTSGKPTLAMQYLPNNKGPNQKFVMGGLSSKALDFVGSSVTHERKFPSELKLTLKNQGKEVENNWQKYYRNVITAEQGRHFKNSPKFLLPKLEIEDTIPEEYKKSTGGKSSPIEQPYTAKRVATAHVKRKSERGKLRSQQSGQTGSKRPDSRYNKESLYMKLDYGRAASPEYKVPILDMNFAEVINHQIIPDCWKQDPI